MDEEFKLFLKDNGFTWIMFIPGKTTEQEFLIKDPNFSRKIIDSKTKIIYLYKSVDILPNSATFLNGKLETLSYIPVKQITYPQIIEHVSNEYVSRKNSVLAEGYVNYSFDNLGFGVETDSNGVVRRVNQYISKISQKAETTVETNKHYSMNTYVKIGSLIVIVIICIFLISYLVKIMIKKRKHIDEV